MCCSLKQGAVCEQQNLRMGRRPISTAGFQSLIVNKYVKMTCQIRIDRFTQKCGSSSPSKSTISCNSEAFELQDGSKNSEFSKLK